jgi:pumilio family protein 6
MEALLIPLGTTYPSDDHPHPIALPHTSRLYKVLLQGGHFSQAINAVVTRPNFDPSIFATAFLRHVKLADITAIARGGGAFVIAVLLERVVSDGTPEECGGLKECLSALRDDEGQSIKGWAALSEGIRLLGSKAVDVTLT